MLAYTRDMSTKEATRPTAQPSSPNPTEGENGPAILAPLEATPHVYGVHTRGPRRPAPMPIYLGAQNTPTHRAHEAEQAAAEQAPLGPQAHPSPARHDAPSSAYDPAALLRHLVLLLALLLGLTLWLGGWQPHTSDARLGWSHGTISVVEGTDGDTGAHPLSPHDEGVRPSVPNATLRSVSPEPGEAALPVDHWETFFEGSGPGGASILGQSGGSAA